MSRLLKFLAEELAKASGAKELLHAKTRLAIHLARRGEVEAANRTISEVRALGGTALKAESTARANLAEGVASFCVGNLEVAVDKLRRARALGDAANLPQVSRWACAWLAHVEFNMGRVAELRPYAIQLLENAPTDEHWALSRIGSTIAAGLHFANRFDLARPWYEFARQHAVAEGDDLTIDANLHNVAAFRVHNLRLSEVLGEVDLDELRRADQEFHSSSNYDAMKASQSFRWTIPLIEMQLDLLARRIDVAEGKFAKWIGEFRGVAPERLFVLSVADHALCLAEQDDVVNAVAQSNNALESLPKDMAVDEMALLSYRRSQIAFLAGNEDLRVQLRADAHDLLDAHSKAQIQFATAFAAITLPSSSPSQTAN